MKDEKASRIIEQLQAKKARYEAAVRTKQRREQYFSDRYTSVLNGLKTGLIQTREQPLDQKIQTSLAEFACLLTDIGTTENLRLRRNPHLLDAVDVSIQALLSEPPNIELAARTREDIYRQLHPTIHGGLYASFKRSMQTSPSAAIVCGLGILSCVLGALLVLLAVVGFLTHSPMNVVESGLVDSTKYNVHSDGLLLIGMAGALGSIVSIMIRVDQFSYLRGSDPWPFFFLGIFKPIVGAASALFIFAVLGANMLVLKLPTDDPQALGLLFLTVAFTAGFSERVAADVVASVEHVLLDDEGVPDSRNGEPSRNGDDREGRRTLNGKPHPVSGE